MKKKKLIVLDESAIKMLDILADSTNCNHSQLIQQAIYKLFSSVTIIKEQMYIAPKELLKKTVIDYLNRQKPNYEDYQQYEM